jgi:hypothetical protein
MIRPTAVVTSHPSEMATISSAIVLLPASQSTAPPPVSIRPRSTIPEPKPLDHRILQHGGTTSTLDILPHRVQLSKSQPVDSASRIEELIHEVDYLRKEIVRLKKREEALLGLRECFIQVFYSSRTALQQFSDKAMAADRELSGYWGLQLDDTEEEDIVMF